MEGLSSLSMLYLLSAGTVGVKGGALDAGGADYK